MSALARWLDDLPLVAILRGVKPGEVVAVGAALVEAGISMIEVPLNSPEPFKSSAALAKTCGDGALVGAGTVLDPADVARVAEAGGRLVVTPNAEPAVVEACKARGLWPFTHFNRLHVVPPLIISVDDARLWLLLETIGQAAVGLRRELALDPADRLPADYVADAFADSPARVAAARVSAAFRLHWSSSIPPLAGWTWASWKPGSTIRPARSRSSRSSATSSRRALLSSSERESSAFQSGTLRPEPEISLE